MYRVYHHKTLDVFVAMFTINNDVHGYNTRQSNHFHLPKPKKELKKSSLDYRGAIIWNNILSHDININLKEQGFSKELQKSIKNGNCII